MNIQRRIKRTSRPRARHAFTLVELIVAGMAALFVIGAVTIALFQSSRARETTKTRLTAFSRANAALDTLRREISSVMRRSDLFETRLLLYNDSVTTSDGEFDRDELLLFNTNLRPTRPNEDSGEGQEYESQFRIGEDRTGIALWQRRDAVPDEWSDAGGLAIPIATGIVGMKIEAYDGIEQNLALLSESGARAILHTDSAEGIQRMNQEAAKAYWAGLHSGVKLTEHDALKWITINPAWALGVHESVGSLAVGKSADLVLWDRHPFSVYTKAQLVLIDGVVRHDSEKQEPVWSDFEVGQ